METKIDLLEVRKAFEEMKEDFEEVQKMEKQYIFLSGKLNEEIQTLYKDRMEEVKKMGEALKEKAEKYNYWVQKNKTKYFSDCVAPDGQVNWVLSTLKTLPPGIIQ